MTCCLCGTETDRGHHCAYRGCDRWICEGCAEGCAMCEDHWVKTKMEAGV